MKIPIIQNDSDETTRKKTKEVKKVLEDLRSQAEASGVNLPFGDVSIGSQTLTISAEDLESLGNNFRPVSREETEEKTVTVDNRTTQDLKEEALTQIVNVIHVPEGLEEEARKRLVESTEELTDFLSYEIMPVLLSIQPACAIVKEAIPKVLGSDMESDDSSLAVSAIQGFAQEAAYVKMQLKVLDMLNLPNEAKGKILDKVLGRGKHDE